MYIQLLAVHKTYWQGNHRFCSLAASSTCTHLQKKMSLSEVLACMACRTTYLPGKSALKKKALVFALHTPCGAPTHPALRTHLPVTDNFTDRICFKHYTYMSIFIPMIVRQWLYTHSIANSLPWEKMEISLSCCMYCVCCLWLLYSSSWRRRLTVWVGGETPYMPF